MSRLLPLLILVLALPAGAQDVSPVVVNQPGDERFLFELPRREVIPDTTEPWRYFPLHVGNTWEYLQTDGSFQRRYVEKDTLIEGTRYFIIKGQNFTAQGEPTPLINRTPFRFDTLTARIMRPSGPWPADCPLDLPFGSTCYDDHISVGGGYGHLLVFPLPKGADSVYTAV